MPNTDHTPEDILNSQAPSLTHEERADLWRHVETRIGAPIPSPYHFIFSSTKHMISLLVLFALLLGAGGTVAASDSARPGDILFPVDRAIEDIRLAIAPSGEKVSLKIKFANERLNEFESVTSQALNDSLTGLTIGTTTATVFTNETIVKVNAGNKKALFTTATTTRPGIISAIVTKYGFASTSVDAVLTITTENRASTPADGAFLSNNNQIRVQNALNALTTFLENNNAGTSSPQASTAIRIIEERLRDRSTFLPEKIRVKIKGDEGRIELRGDDGRIRVEIKDGEVRIKDKRDDDDDRDEDHDDDNRGNNATTTATSTISTRLNIEVDVFTDLAVVKVIQGFTKTYFNTATTTRAGIIEEIIKKLPTLTTAQVNSVIDFDFEDRASREKERAGTTVGTTTVPFSLKIEANVFTSTTTVKVHQLGNTTTFDIGTTTTSGVIAQILARYPLLTSAQVTSALKFNNKSESENHSNSGRDDDRDDENEDDD